MPLCEVRIKKTPSSGSATISRHWRRRSSSASLSLVPNVCVLLRSEGGRAHLGGIRRSLVAMAVWRFWVPPLRLHQQLGQQTSRGACSASFAATQSFSAHPATQSPQPVRQHPHRLRPVHEPRRRRRLCLPLFRTELHRQHGLQRLHLGPRYVLQQYRLLHGGDVQHVDRILLLRD